MLCSSLLCYATPTQAVEKVPAKDAGDLYIRYAKLEETHGLMRHAASVLDRACAAVEESERLDMFRLYVAKVQVYTLCAYVSFYFILFYFFMSHMSFTCIVFSGMSSVLCLFLSQVGAVVPVLAQTPTLVLSLDPIPDSNPSSKP